MTKTNIVSCPNCKKNVEVIITIAIRLSRSGNIKGATQNHNIECTQCYYTLTEEEKNKLVQLLDIKISQ